MKFIDYPTKVGDGSCFFTGTLNGEKAWADGWVMFLGAHPDNGETWESKDFSRAIQGSDPGGMPEIRPICVKALDSGDCAVWFSDCATVIKYRFFLAAYERFGRLRYFSDRLIQSASAVTPQPANDNPEDRQNRK